MKPLGNRALILMPEDKVNEKVGGIIMPANMEKDQFPQVKVLAVGPKCVEVKAGDIVIIDRYAATSFRITYNAKPHFLISEPDIIGIITK